MFVLKTEHLGSKTYLNGCYRTIETAGTTMPALFRVLHYGKLLPFVEMDHIERTVQIARAAFLTLLQVDDRWHRPHPLFVFFSSQGRDRTVIKLLEFRFHPLVCFP